MVELKVAQSACTLKVESVKIAQNVAKYLRYCCNLRQKCHHDYSKTAQSGHNEGT